MGILDMENPEDRLRLMDQRLANMIRQTEDPVALRLFACECADLALSRCNSPDARCVHAVEVSRRFAQGDARPHELESARQDAEQAAISIQRYSDELEQAFKAGKASKDEDTRACYHGFAALSAYDCTVPSAKMAATMAAYETSHAHAGDLHKESERARAEQNDRLTKIAERVLAPSATKRRTTRGR